MRCCICGTREGHIYGRSMCGMVVIPNCDRCRSLCDKIPIERWLRISLSLQKAKADKPKEEFRRYVREKLSKILFKGGLT